MSSVASVKMHVNSIMDWQGTISNEVVNNMFASLSDMGLDCLTNARIEHILCTSALCAFN